MEHERQELEQWQSAVVFDRRIRSLLAKIESADLFCNPQTRWLLDAQLASRFGQATDATQVRLVPRPATRPDFEVRLRNRRLLRVEATEALLPGRRRGDEYRQAKAQGYPARLGIGGVGEDKRRAIALSVTAAVQRKISGGYAPDVSLLIYVNIATHGRWHTEIERDLMKCTERARNYFNEVWVLWSGRICRC